MRVATLTTTPCYVGLSKKWRNKMSKKGRDPVFKCSICGKFIAYEDINTDKVKREMGNTIDTMLETVEFYHTKCETKDN